MADHDTIQEAGTAGDADPTTASEPTMEREQDPAGPGDDRADAALDHAHPADGAGHADGPQAPADPAADGPDVPGVPPAPPAEPVAWPTAVQPAATPPSEGAVPLDSTARNWGLLAHVSGFVASSFVGLGFLGPLAVWLLKREDHPFIAWHAAEAFNFQLSMFVYALLLVVASLPLVTLVATIPLAVIGFVLWLVLPIVAAVKASNGESWQYPLTIGFLRP